MATSTVTIDKAYFETLLRRAQFHTTETDFTTPLLPGVTIQRADYDSLLATAQQYENLRRNLLRGGVTDGTLAVLTQDDAPISFAAFTADETETEGGVYLTPAQQSLIENQGSDHGEQHVISRKNDGYRPQDRRTADNNTSQSCSPVDECVYTPDGPSDEPDEGESGNNESLVKPARQRYEKFAKRTIVLTNIPDVTTHADVANVVRGGLVLEIYLRWDRPNGRAACISFLEAAHAHEFFQYAKRNDVYIRGKRVAVRWGERQFILPGYVANKISIGATRNLVIHQWDPNQTEDSLREDLEHIHNLVVIKVTFRGSDTHISTNSVHNALFARTCMMSRAKYKGCKIEWDPDECAVPVEARRQSLTFNAAPKKTTSTGIMNRFQLLNMEVTDGDSNDEDHNSNEDAFGGDFAASVEGSIA